MVLGMTHELVDTTDKSLWELPDGVEASQVARVVCTFLDTATTAFGRATHYNSRQEQDAAELSAHREMLQLDRSLYSVLLALPGTTDRSSQIGLVNLLGSQRGQNGVASGLLSASQERELLGHLCGALPPHRMLKMFDALRRGNEELGIRKANNARTRKLILRTLLGSHRLQLWAVKYRAKVGRALVHAWNRRRASIIRQILHRDSRLWSAKEKGIVAQSIDKYSKGPAECVRECVRFVFGDRERLTLPLLVAFEAAKKDLTAGKGLPLEVLQGLRGTYHPDVEIGKCLEIAKASLTKTQKKNVQRQAEKAEVDVEMDPMDYGAVDLYLYAFERGMSDAIEQAMKLKAERAARLIPGRWEHVGIVVDASQSMEGSRTQRLRPMAATLALRDMLEKTGKGCVVRYCGGAFDNYGLIRPMGDTAIAEEFVRVLDTASALDVVFVISDGYENAPAGRFAETLACVRELGINIPVYHLNPVMAAEAGGVKELAPGMGVPTMPVARPDALGVTLVRGMIEAEPVRGINLLIRRALEAGPCGNGKPQLGA